ncbi:hypothetical protein [Azotobacter chroococcum]|uniref:Uncharacterized protein n=1 Tax=Azotobacter chroococcum NCIMB 8003 TaxID=1328314 RepID=A0A0C4WY28_9GAMM|nr:hypothetical protein [Azotobacter chroococcum]AJE23887.1 Hypothetical protein Achr_f1930 [Azotobacter chroococcum NCIMB 8003]
MFDGGHLLQAMALDIERFFNNSYRFRYRVYGSKNMSTAENGSPLAVYAQDVGLKEIENLKDACLILLIGCHEAAHALNRHNLIKSTSEINAIKDDISLEVFADFFGAKLFQTLVLIGRETRILFKRCGYKKLQTLYDDMGDALEILYRSYYQWGESSGRYESSLSRVGLCVAGVNSVLDRFLGVDPYRSFMIFEKLHKGTNLNDQRKPYLADKEIPHHAGMLMAKVQDGNSMFPGIYPEISYLLGGYSYITDAEEKQAYVRAKQAELRRYGIEIPE